MDMYAYPYTCETLFLTWKMSSLLEETKPNTYTSLDWISFCQATWSLSKPKKPRKDVKKAKWKRLGRSCSKFQKSINLDEPLQKGLCSPRTNKTEQEHSKNPGMNLFSLCLKIPLPVKHPPVLQSWANIDKTTVVSVNYSKQAPISLGLDTRNKIIIRK